MQTEPLEGIAQIGEPLSILIFLTDKSSSETIFDVAAQDCWAYNSDQFNRAETDRVQLTDKDGCPL